MSVAETLALSFLQARKQQQNILRQWNSVSYKLGPRLGASLLVFSIQQQGETDAVLRCIEDELADANRREKIDFVTTPYVSMATYWIGAVYEFLRLLRDRKMLTEEGSEELFRKFELLRMPLEKHEIAKDKAFKEPQKMTRVPPNEDGSDYYTYDPRSSERSHIMPSGLSARGSITWQAIDAKNQSSEWIERRALSDMVLVLWGQAQT